MSEERTLQLETAVSIAQAEALAHQLEEAFRQGAPVVVDASRVERADTAGLQVLLAFFNSMRESGIAVRMAPVSDAMVRAVELLGLRSHLLS